MAKPIYVVVTPFFPSDSDWTGSFCFDFVQALVKDGRYDVRVFKPGKADYEIDGIRVNSFNIRALPSSIMPFFYEKENVAAFLNAVLRSGVDIQNIEVCHCHTATFVSYGIGIKRLNPRVKFFLHHHDPQSFGLGGGVLKHCWLYNLLLFPRFRSRFEIVDRHVYVSGMVGESFEKAPDASWTCYNDYARQMRALPWRPVCVKGSQVLYNGVNDVAFYKKCSASDDKRDYVIGYVANFVEWKNPLSLLRVFKELKGKGLNVRLKMLGGDSTLGRIQKIKGGLSLKSKCKKFVEKYKLESCVEFCTEVPHSRLPSFFWSIDLLVVPSYFEGFGCVFTEAYSCGVPFICCEGQGISEIAPQQWQVKPKNDAALRDKIVEFIEDRGGIRELKLRKEYRIKPLVEEFLCSI